MNNKTLLSVALICSLIGIFIILLIVEKIEYPYIKISSIDKTMLEQEVKIKGEVESLTKRSNLLILNIKDETGKIQVVVFETNNLTIKENSIAEIQGTVTEYQNKLQLEANIIKIIK